MRYIRLLVEEVLSCVQPGNDDWLILADLAYNAGEEIGMTKQELDKLAKGYDETENR